MSDKKPVNAMYGTKMSLNLDKIKNKPKDEEVVEENPDVEQIEEPVVDAPVEEAPASEEVVEEVQEVVEEESAPDEEDDGVEETVETSVDYNVVSRLKKELSMKNEKLSNQSNELNYLTNKVIPRLKKENSELKSVKIELTDALEKSTRKYFDQLDINEDLSNEIGKLGADGAVNKVRADKLEAELETIKSDYESKISDLKDELNSKDIHEVDKLKEQNETLKQRIEELNNDIDSLKDENNKTIADLRKQVKKLEEQLEKESNKGLFNRFK